MKPTPGHTLLDVEDAEELSAHPKVGASWEGFALDTIVTHLGARRDECHFWGSHSGAELDLLIVRGPKRYGFELKRTDAPRSTRSMHAAMDTRPGPPRRRARGPGDVPAPRADPGAGAARRADDVGAAAVTDRWTHARRSGCDRELGGGMLTQKVDILAALAAFLTVCVDD